MKTGRLGLQGERGDMAQKRFVGKLFHLGFLMKRPMTLGVRLLATNQMEEILLVKHTYVPGWYLPGGGVETGETALEAACKELSEETGHAPGKAPTLLGVYFNRRASARDHVLLYRCENVEKIRDFLPNREIAEIGFFPVNQLPDGMTKGSANRIEEHILGQPVSEFW